MKDYNLEKYTTPMRYYRCHSVVRLSIYETVIQVIETISSLSYDNNNMIQEFNVDWTPKPQVR